MSVDHTINIGTLINAPLTILLFGIMFTWMHKYWKRNNKMHKLNQIELKSIVHAVFVSLNGSAGAARKEYERKKNELMADEDFLDEQ